eukprot:SAG11_NODE_420_length_9631_cov_12.805558_7_plen_40_part_00
MPDKKFERAFKQIDKSGNGEIEFNELLVTLPFPARTSIR